MTTIVDARGLACPEPVIQTRKAMQQADQVVTLVDNESSLTNVSRMAEKAGWQVNAIREDTGYRIELARGTAVPRAESLPVGRTEAISGPLVLVVSAEAMGRGEPELGALLIRSFFHTLGEVPWTARPLRFAMESRSEAEWPGTGVSHRQGNGPSPLRCGDCHTPQGIWPQPHTIVFLNTGVKLVCQGSPVLDDLHTLENKGVEMLVCGTCLGYFELKAKLAVGQVSNMYDIAETMLSAGKVVNL